MLAFSTALLAGAAVAQPTASASHGQNSCMKKSTQVTEWTVEDFDFHSSYIFSTPAHQNSWGYVNFTLANPAVEYPLQCSSKSSWLQDFYYGMVNYDCTAPDGKSGAGSFNFSRPLNELKINQSWSCPEGGSFWAEGSVRLDLSCSEDYWENPDWKPGQVYTSRTITCDKVTVPAKIDSLRAAA